MDGGTVNRLKCVVASDTMGQRSEFVTAMVVFLSFSLFIAALISPPDPFTQLIYAVPLIALSIPVAYWLAYRDGYERLQRTWDSNP